MTEHATPHPTDLVPLETVRQAAGVADRTLREWIRAEQIATYSQGDRRKRFVRREDAEYLLRPRVVPRRHAEPVRA